MNSAVIGKESYFILMWRPDVFSPRYVMGILDYWNSSIIIGRSNHRAIGTIIVLVV